MDRKGRVELLRCRFAGAVEGALADINGVFLNPGEKRRSSAVRGLALCFFRFVAYPHCAIKYECENAIQRMRTDAVRQPVISGSQFDVELQNPERV